MFLAWRRVAGEALLAACVCGLASAGLEGAREGTRAFTPQTLQAPQATPGSAEDIATAAAFVDDYYAALNAADLEAVIRLWSREMPVRGQMAAALARQFDRERPTFSDLRIARTTITGDRARLLIRATVRTTPTAAAAATTAPSTPAPSSSAPSTSAPIAVAPPASSASPSATSSSTSDATDLPDSRASQPREAAGVTLRTVFLLSRDPGGWRLYEEKSPTQDLADRLAEAESEAAADRLTEEEVYAAPDAVLLVARALLAAGGSAMSRGQYAEALRAYARAERLAEGARARALAAPAVCDSFIAESWLFRAFVHLYQRPTPEPERALAPLTRALAIYEAGHETSRIAETRQAMGTAAYALGDYAGALAEWERALAGHRATGDAPSIVRAQLGIGNVRYLFAEPDAARAAYGEALALSSASPETSADAIRALQGLGRVAVSLGDYAGGREQHAQALVRLERSGSRGEQAAALMEIGRTDFLRGRLEDARAQYAKALAIEEELSDRAGQGDVLQALALVDVLNADAAAAIATYTRSAAAYMQAASRREADVGVGQALLGRASVWLDTRDEPRALADFTDSLARFEAARDVEGAARAQLGLAMTHVLGRRAAEALASAARADASAERLGLPDIRWQAQLEAGRARLLAGERDQAKAAFDAAVRIMEESRLESVRDARTPARRAAPHAALVDWHIAVGDAAGALLAADDGKRRVLEDLLQPFRARLTSGIDTARAAEEARLVGRRVSLLAQLRRERDRASSDAARLASLQQALGEARAATEAWQRDVARDAPRVPFIRGEARFSSLDALEAALPDDAALIQFVSSDDRLFVIVATTRAAASPEARAREPGTPDARASEAGARDARLSRLELRAYARDVTRADLADRVWHFANAVARGTQDTKANDAPDARGRPARVASSDAGTASTTTAAAESDAARSGAGDAAGDAESRALFELLLGPARAQLAGRSALIVVPDDVLWLLPFEALDTRPLLETRPPLDTRSSAASEQAAEASPAEPSTAASASASRSAGAPRYLTELASITYLPSVATWLARPATVADSDSPMPTPPASSASTSSSAAPRSDASPPSHVHFAAASIVDISPLQSTITLAADDAGGELPAAASSASAASSSASSASPGAAPATPTAATATPPSHPVASVRPAPVQPAPVLQTPVLPTPVLPAIGQPATARPSTDPSATDLPASDQPATAADWLTRSLSAELAIIPEVTQSPERLRLDVGRLGMVAVACSLATAGVPRTLVARRALDPATRARVLRDVTDALTRSSSPSDVAGAVRAAIAAARADRALGDPRHWAIWLPIGPPATR